MASTAQITTRPRYLDSNNLVYNFWDLRPGDKGAAPRGPGVAGFSDFRVIPRQAGANRSVDVGAGSIMQTAWVRGGTRGGQGLYEVDTILKTAPTTDSYVPQLNVDISANASGNPRIDQVIIEVLDSMHAGASNIAQIRVVAGTPTAGATLDNRSGAATITGSYVLLADVIAANGFSTITAAQIRDRRPFPLNGTLPPTPTEIPLTVIEPPAALGASVRTFSTSHNNNTAACAVFVPSRTTVTSLRWRYHTGGSPAPSGSYRFGIYDATGTKLAETGVISVAGNASVVVSVSDAITPTLLEPGWYWLAFGLSLTAGSFTARAMSAQSESGGEPGAPSINMMVGGATGTTLPGQIAAYANDFGSLNAYSVLVPVPAVTLVG